MLSAAINTLQVMLILIAVLDMAWCALSLIEVAHDVLHYLWPGSDVLYYGVIVLKVCKFF